MSESLDPTATAELPQENFNEILDSIATPPKSRAVRQGLPSDYRMRHDSHYVEDLGARPPAPRAEQPSQISYGPGAIPTTAALRDLCQEFEGLASCFNLIQQGARPLRERLGVTLARIGVQRSIRYAQNLRLLLDEQHHVSQHEVRVDDLIRQALAELKEELRLIESVAIVDLSDMPLTLRGDTALLLNGLRASLSTAVALIESSGISADLYVAAFTSGDMLHCEIRQDAYTPEPRHLSRLFDMESNDRPGSRTIAVALSAARRVAVLHGGQFEVRSAASVGCAFLFSLPKSATGSLPIKTN